MRWRAPARSEPALTGGARHPNAVVQLSQYSLPQLLAVLEVNGGLRAVNAAWRHLGLAAQQLRGQSNLSLLQADDQAAAQPWCRRATSSSDPAGFDGCPTWSC